MTRMLKTAGARSLRCVLIAGASAAAMSATAFAQSGAAPDSDEARDEVVVTGSRLKRAEFESDLPTITTTADDIENRGFTNVAEILNENPAFGQGASSVGGQSGFGAGSNFVSLFNLGSNRTLTVVNGRRFIGSNQSTLFGAGAPGLQVDLNVIPTSLVDRIETVSVGGAPIYGADAVAGTVNVILKDDYDGFGFDIQGGAADDLDAENYKVEAIFGKNFAGGRGNFTATVQYSDNNGLLQTERTRTARQILFGANPLNTSLTDGIPGNIPLENRRLPILNFSGAVLSANSSALTLNRACLAANPANKLIAVGGASQLRQQVAAADVLDPAKVPTACLPTGYVRGSGVPVFAAAPLQFDAAGNLVPMDLGALDTFTPFSSQVASGGDGLNLAPTGQILSDQRRFIAAGNAHYDVTDDIRASFEWLYSNAKSKELANQPTFNTPLFTGQSAGLTFNISGPNANPYLTPQNLAVLSGLRTAAGAPITTITLSRANAQLTGDNPSLSNLTLYRFAGGLDGKFNLLDRDWDWQVSGLWGRSHAESTNFTVHDVRFELARDAVRDSSGNIVCRAKTPGFVAPASFFGTPVTQADIDQCVPINLFGLNSASQAAIDYVRVQLDTASTNEQFDFFGTLQTDLFTLPAGAVKLLGGVEWRREETRFAPGPAQQQGLGRTAAIVPTSGAYNSKEFFGETSIPVFGGDFTPPLFRNLEINGAVRYVDNSLAGGDLTWTGGGRWSPIKDIEFRGNRTRSIRSPAIVEQFLGVQTAFSTAADPCDSTLISAGSAPANRAANCAAAAAAAGFGGLPTFISNVRFATVQGTSSGNPNLDNEIADSWSVGVVLRPRFVPGLTLAADYVDIFIQGIITSLSLTQSMQFCFDSAPSSFPNSFCSNFTRDAAFQVTTFNNNFANLGFQDFNGLQATLEYEREVSDILGMVGLGDDRDLGKIVLRNNAFFNRRRDVSGDGTIANTNPAAGELGDERVNTQTSLTYTKGPFQAFWQWQRLSGYAADVTFTIENQNPFKFDDYNLHGASIQYKFTPHFTGRMVVNNVFNNQPPEFLGGGGLAIYDYVGRSFVLGLHGEF